MYFNVDPSKPESSVKITLAIPTYNAEKFIRTTLQSCLEQVQSPHEILVSDDGSSDLTVSILEEYKSHPKIKIISPPERLGIGAHYRYLAQAATGTHAVILSCDDALHPNFVKRSVQILEKAPDLGMLIFSGYLCNAAMKPQSRFGLSYPKTILSPPHGFKHFVQACTYLISFTVWQTELLKSFPPLPDNAGLATDWYWALMAGLQSSILFSRQPLGYYRYHDQNASHSDSDRWSQQAQNMLRFISSYPLLESEKKDILITLQNKLKEKPTASNSQNSVKNPLKKLIKYVFANILSEHPNFLKQSLRK